MADSKQLVPMTVQEVEAHYMSKNDFRQLFRNDWDVFLPDWDDVPAPFAFQLFTKVLKIS